MSILFDEKQWKPLLELRKCNLKEYYKDITFKEKLDEEDMSKFCDSIRLNSDDLRKRETFLTLLQNMLTSGGIPCKLYYFGSTINGIGFYDSDIDIYLQLLSKHPDGRPEIPKDYRNLLRNISKCISRKSSFKQLYQIHLIWAKCSIIKFVTIPNNSTQSKQAGGMIEVDLNVSHPIGVFNSVVINYLVSFEYRIQQLCTILKHWAKLNTLIHLNGFKSYALVFLVIFFLQNCDPPYILSLDAIFEFANHFENYVQPEFESKLFEQCSKLLINADKLPSTLELLHQFFNFYYHFDFLNFVISPRLGISIRKDHFRQIIFDDERHLDFRINPYLCLEDPFELDRNITSNMSFLKFEQFIRICTILAKKPADCFEKGSYFRHFISQSSNTILMPNTIPHIAQFCPCVCFSQKYFSQLDQQKRNNCYTLKSELEQIINLILEYAKAIMQSLVEKLQSCQEEDKFKRKFKYIEHKVFSKCFNRWGEKKDMLTNSNEKFELANIQIKISDDHTPNKNKKQKTASSSTITHINNDAISNQRYWDGMNLEDLATNPEISTESDAHMLLKSISLFCEFISEKVYIVYFKSNESIPICVQKLLKQSGNNLCTCQAQLTLEEDEEEEDEELKH